MKIISRLWIWLAALVIISPAGFILAGYFKAGPGWGEWDAAQIEKMAGYIPRGFHKLCGLWTAPIPDYRFKGWEGKGLPQLSFAYIISAVIGIAVIVLAVMVLGKLFIKRDG